LLNGKVNSQLEAVVRLLIRSPEGRVLEIEVVVDTGFSGSLSLPHEAIAGLGLVPYGRVLGILADGTKSFFPMYRVIVLWHGQSQLISVSAVGSAPLLGMSMLRGSEFAMQVIEGGEVAIHELSVP
jgi:clan AA aspartic protease